MARALDDFVSIKASARAIPSCSSIAGTGTSIVFRVPELMLNLPSAVIARKLLFWPGHGKRLESRLGPEERGGLGGERSEESCMAHGRPSRIGDFSGMSGADRGFKQRNTGRENTEGLRFAKYFAGQRFTVGWPR